ncbi:hypothetical protein [Polynucleobacter sp. AP-Reno-20A-A9]|uniref:hypothetical protein n=1 Tax=Polynucleobacter sp. AP-Reno-20A-A9 TaxID=2576925 RepID=UPI001C0C56C5|nr:hypothetical protein [Polynucleobacter sp. AP-Reno-20A-A9]MBU3628861.1 hypothetical protein [Polynucleobacter sp. AP-Reno-20A-A9]
MSSRSLLLMRFVVIAICLELPLILSYFWMTGDFSVHRFNVWPITEWLINYQAGFIRRGLAGELLLRFFGGTGMLGALYKAMFFSFALYVACFLLVYLKSGIRNANVLLVAILIQGGIFHMGMSADFYTRKENIFLIFFAIQCLLFMQIKTAAEGHKRYWTYLYLFLLLTISPLLVLVHEAYLFLSFPVSALLLWVLSIEQPQWRYLRYGFIFLCIEAVATFLICSHFHGDVAMSQGIWEALPFTDRVALSPAAPYSAFGAIGSLGWGLDQHLTTLYGVISSGGIFVWIFFGAGNLLVLLYIFSAIRPNAVNGTQSQYSRWIFIGFLTLLPMFLVASDWGRWIASLSNQMILLMLTLCSSGLSLKPETNSFWLIVGRHACAPRGAVLLGACIIYGLVFQMPECCVYYKDIYPPFGQYWKLLIGF